MYGLGQGVALEGGLKVLSLVLVLLKLEGRPTVTEIGAVKGSACVVVAGAARGPTGTVIVGMGPMLARLGFQAGGGDDATEGVSLPGNGIQAGAGDAEATGTVLELGFFAKILSNPPIKAPSGPFGRKAGLGSPVAAADGAAAAGGGAAVGVETTVMDVIVAGDGFCLFHGRSGIAVPLGSSSGSRRLERAESKPTGALVSFGGSWRSKKPERKETIPAALLVVLAAVVVVSGQRAALCLPVISTVGVGRCHVRWI